MSRKSTKRNPFSNDHATRSLVILAGNPIWKALSKAPMAARRQTRVNLGARAAYDEIIAGRGARCHSNELMLSAMTGAVLSERGYGPEYAQQFVDAHHAAKACLQKATDNGQVTFSTDIDRRQILEMLELHEQQLQLASREEVASALMEGYRRTA